MSTRIRCTNPGCQLSFDDSRAAGDLRCPNCGSDCGPDSGSETDLRGPSGRGGSEAKVGSSSKNSPWDLPRNSILGGRFRIERKLGEGGMGAVYLAEDSKLRRKVALKVPHPHLYEDNPIFVERLIREAQIAAGFHHKNICQIHDVGLSAGRHFIVMHYVEGKTLSESLAVRSYTPAEASRLVRSVAETLQKAHDKRIIHRDLKPSNLMIDADGELIIMDFGLAKRTDDDAEDGLKTKHGAFVGTLAYAPPEQVEGRSERIGPGTDIYSLGVILYELLTGRLPFQGTRYVLMTRILEAEPDPPSTHSSGVGEELDAIVRKAMAKKVEDRYLSMSQFAEALEGCPERPTRPPPRRSTTDPIPPAPSQPVSDFEPASGVWPTEDTPSSLDDESPIAADDFEFISAGPIPAPPSINAPGRLVRPSGVSLVPIGPGTFVMGSIAGDEDEKPPRKVRLTSAFLLGRYPITHREYEAVSGASPGFFRAEPDRPVEQVSWLDAIKFCNLIGEKEGLPPFYAIKREGEVAVPDWRAPGYRLPTEAEWEYACRAGRTSAFGFGDDPLQVDGHAWHAGNSHQQTHKVGLKRPNAWGLHDMHGNVWEWCWDWYEPRYYHAAGDVDPRGPDSPRKFRSLRGGHWGDEVVDLRSANRIWFEPSIRVRFIGFRLARSA